MTADGIVELDCRKIPPGDAARQAALTILRQGVVKLAGAFDPVLIEAWRAQFESHIRGAVSRRQYRYRLVSLGERRHHYTLEIHQRFNDPSFYANPVLYGAAALLMEHNFIMATTAVAYAEPKAPPQYIHRDQVMLFANPELNAALPPVSLTISIPLVATNDTVGGTEFMPGSHREMELSRRPVFVRAETAPGDCLVWDSRCFHRGCANPGDIARPIVLQYYQRPWYFNFLNYAPDCEIKITEANLARVPAPFRHLFDWSRPLFVPPCFAAGEGGLCDCGSGLAFGACHGMS